MLTRRGKLVLLLVAFMIGILSGPWFIYNAGH